MELTEQEKKRLHIAMYLLYEGVNQLDNLKDDIRGRTNADVKGLLKDIMNISKSVAQVENKYYNLTDSEQKEIEEWVKNNVFAEKFRSSFIR